MGGTIVISAVGFGEGRGTFVACVKLMKIGLVSVYAAVLLLKLNEGGAVVGFRFVKFRYGIVMGRMELVIIDGRLCTFCVVFGGDVVSSACVVF